MKILLLVVASFISCYAIQAQTTPVKDTIALVEKDTVFTRAEIEPCYPGGLRIWQAYLKSRLIYPDEAMNKGIQGDVTIQFIVDKDGKVSNIKAVAGDPLLIDEGIRLIKKSGKWVPAVQRGHTVKAYKLQTISFKID